MRASLRPVHGRNGLHEWLAGKDSNTGAVEKTLSKIIFINMFYYSQPASRLPKPGYFTQISETEL